MRFNLKGLNISRRTAVMLVLFIMAPVLIYLSDPYPTKPLNLAVGQKGTSYEVLGRHIARLRGLVG